MAVDKKEKAKEKPKDYIYENENAKSNPYWFQVMVNGQRVTKRGFRTRGEAKKARANIIAELSQDRYVEPSKKRYADYFEEWLSSRRSIADNTHKMYRLHFKNHIGPVLGDIPLSKLTASDIDNLLNGLKEKGLGEDMVWRNFTIVHASLNAAVKKEILVKNVAAKVEKPKVHVKERAMMDTDEIQHILRVSRGYSRNWIAVYLAVMTGMRIGEICGLMWKDIDFNAGMIYVRRNMLDVQKTISTLKTKKSQRALAISPQVVAVLKEHMANQELEKLRDSNYQDQGLVVCTSKGTPALQNRIRLTWQKMQEKYKSPEQPKMRFHDLRHAHASILLQRKVHPKVVSERLGHSTTAITMEIYSHLMPHLQHEAVQGLEEEINLGDSEEDVVPPNDPQ